MSRSMKILGNNLVRRAAGWMASFLAVASVFLGGRSGEVSATLVGSQKSDTAYMGQETGTQFSYVQLGFKDGEDWPPPRPE
jgi:hypothetical protein